LVEETGGQGENLLKFRDITDIFIPNFFGTINVMTNIGFKRLQYSPKYQTFQFFRGGQFYWLRRPEDREKTNLISYVRRSRVLKYLNHK
jgi:hypothetical protein